MRKELCFVTACAMLATGCSASNMERYERGQNYLGCGDYATAETIFRQLGTYADAGDQALYAGALLAVEAGDHELARANLALLEDFPHEERLARYVDGDEAEVGGDYEAALAIFASLGTYADSAERASALRKAIPARLSSRVKALMAASRWQDALTLMEQSAPENVDASLTELCRSALSAESYSRAETARKAGDYAGAMATYTDLADYRDSADRAEECRRTLYQAAVAASAQVNHANAAQVTAQFAALGAYEDCERRVAELNARWGRVLALISHVSEQPCVVLGSYPTAESGLIASLSWRVCAVENGAALLYATVVTDSVTAEEASGVTFSEEERFAVLSRPLPDAKVLERTGLESCAATPYALAQGVRQDGAGNAWYLLAGEASEGHRAAMRPDGAACEVRTDDVHVGLRPAVWVSLDALTLTEGDGSEENPFR